MNYSRYQVEPDLWLDARRAAWLPSAGVLIVADLHLGYVWALRKSGQLLPIVNTEEPVSRLADLVQSYQPREVVLLGDIVHWAVDCPGLRAELEMLYQQLNGKVQLRWVAGNHDRKLSQLLAECAIPAVLESSLIVGRNLLIHGDTPIENGAEEWRVPSFTGRIIMGHEHPAIRLGDGASGTVKCPCFLVSPSLLVLPAFSSWAAGSVVKRGSLMSVFTRNQSFTQAVAILGEKLLPVPLSTDLSVLVEG
jgi:uncharacterized protein